MNPWCYADVIQGFPQKELDQATGLNPGETDNTPATTHQGPAAFSIPLIPIFVGLFVDVVCAVLVDVHDADHAGAVAPGLYRGPHASDELEPRKAGRQARRLLADGRG